jgi:hypothetical protein
MLGGDIITLVPFAGINLIRFRGSRINGLSPRAIRRVGHSDKIGPLTGHNTRGQLKQLTTAKLQLLYALCCGGVNERISAVSGIPLGDVHCQGFTRAG